MFKKKEVSHLKEIDRGVDKLNFWFVVNTAATILTGIFALAIALLTYLK